MSGLMLEPKAQASRNKLLGSAEIRRMLTDYVRRRVSESDVDDVVQTVLVEALSSERVPDERTELRKWLTGVARHKIADLHRRSGREKPSELPDIETGPAPVEEHHLAEWAEREAKKSSKDADATLRWMAREGEGDKLEHIAAEEKLPAATVRQRVSRMRRWMKERWLAEIAAAAAFGVIAFLIYRFVFVKKDPEVVREDLPQPTATQTAHPDKVIAPSPLERAAELRRQAIPSCSSDPTGCLQKLDEAKRLDPAGDASREIESARKAANDAIQNKAAPTATSSADVGPPSTSSAFAPPQSTSSAFAPPQTTSVPPAVKKDGFDGKAAPKAPAKPTSSFDDKKGSFNQATPTGTNGVKPSSVVLDDVPDSMLPQPQANPGPTKGMKK
jgi:RNA polymerase sigma factor (sigma-70 family)